MNIRCRNAYRASKKKFRGSTGVKKEGVASSVPTEALDGADGGRRKEEKAKNGRTASGGGGGEERAHIRRCLRYLQAEEEGTLRGDGGRREV